MPLRSAPLSVMTLAALLAGPGAPAHALTPPTAGGDSLAAALVGAWQGELEYLDYQSDRRVTLPTTLSVDPLPRAGGFVFRYVYDDGPGKTVYSTDTVTVDATARTWTIVSGADRDEYDVAGLEQFQSASGGTLALTGTGTDNDLVVQVRVTVTLTPATLTLLREYRPDGGSPWRYRHEYRFTRVSPPRN